MTCKRSPSPVCFPHERSVIRKFDVNFGWQSEQVIDLTGGLRCHDTHMSSPSCKSRGFSIRIDRNNWHHYPLVELFNALNNLGLYSQTGRTSYHKISWSLSAARFMLSLSNRSKILQAPQEQHCQHACQISARYKHHNIQSRGFNTSRKRAVRRPPT